MTVQHNARYATERRAAILELLGSRGAVQVSALSDAFGVSKVTIRSDLDALEQAGRLRRTHGGAVPLSRAVTVSVQDRRVNVNVEAKRAIARRALSLVEDGDSLLLDSGTTALELARVLTERSGLTIVTNDLTIADFADRSLPHCEVIMLGGMLSKGHRYTVGPVAVSTLRSLHPAKAFVCPTAYAPGGGLLTNNPNMAALKSAFIEAAGMSYLLLDCQKVGKPGLMRFAELGCARALVADADPSGALSADAADAGVELFLAEP